MSRQTWNGHRWRAAGIVFPGVIVLLGCQSGRPTAGGPAAAEKVSPAGSPLVEVTRVVERPVDVTLSLPGELNPYEAVAVFARVTGFIKSIPVDRGSRLRTGDAIARLEAPELTAQRAEAQSKLQGAEAQFVAVRSKVEADRSTYDKLRAAAATPGVVAGNDLVVAQKAVEAGEGQIGAARQGIEAARQALESVRDMEGYLTIAAPFDGVVTERNVHPGALVGPASGPGATTPIVRLVGMQRLRLVVPVPEAYSAGVTGGDQIRFSVAAYPGQTFSGVVSRNAHAVDVHTRTMAVELDVTNQDGRLAPGMFCQVRWPVRRSGNSLMVPSASVASTSDRTFVVRVRSQRAEWVDVKLGLASGPLVEVFGDLRAGDEVATRGTDEMRPGTAVRTKAPKAGS